MIRISDKTQCCGCTACVTVCPAQAIVMRRDREGFDYPVANPDLCVSCGRCEQVCPMPELHQWSGSSSSSSSGEVNINDVKEFISGGGVAYGPVYESDGHVGYREMTEPSSADELICDCIVQGDLYASYEDVSSCLMQGRPVMFIGTPCHLAGLHSCLGETREGLSGIAVSCRGAASPGLWEKCVVSTEMNDAGNELYALLHEQNMILRPSCLDCRLRVRTEEDPAVDMDKRKELFSGSHSNVDIIRHLERFVVRPSFKRRVGRWLSSMGRRS